MPRKQIWAIGAALAGVGIAACALAPRITGPLGLTLPGPLVGAAHGTEDTAASNDAPGKVTLIRPADLPAPYATQSVNNSPQVLSRQPDPLPLRAPPGFTVNLFAEHLHNPRNMALAPDGSVFVALSGANKIAVLRDTTGTGKGDAQTTFADDLRQPFGLAFHDGYLYVGNTDSVVRYPYQTGDTKARGAAQTVVPQLPANGYHNHWTRDLLFSKDGKTLFVSVGSLENVGIDEPRRAAILAFDPDGGNFRIYASGLRNPVGLAIEPKSGQLWTCVNERDGLGNDLPPDYATPVQQGGFYGWPYAYIGPHPDPNFGKRQPDLVEKTITPDVLFRSHSAAVNIVFSTSPKFPQQWRGGAFVSFHGSWNREPRTGYKVVYVPMKNGTPTDGSYVNFLTGFATPDDTVWGRPVGLLVAKDGSLLVCDDDGGRIWRIAYQRATSD